MMDEDNDIYYAQIRGLLTDQYCEKSAVVTWLLPTQDSPPSNESFDPATYILGKPIIYSGYFEILQHTHIFQIKSTLMFFAASLFS